MNREFKKYVDLTGSVEGAAKKLGCSVSKVYKSISGERGLSPKYAKIVCQQYPEISFYALLLPDD